MSPEERRAQNKAMRAEMKREMARLLREEPRTAKTMANNKGLRVLIDPRKLNTKVFWKDCVWQPES